MSEIIDIMITQIDETAGAEIFRTSVPLPSLFDPESGHNHP